MLLVKLLPGTLPRLRNLHLTDSQRMKIRYIPLFALLASVTLTVAGCSTDALNMEMTEKSWNETWNELGTKAMEHSAKNECRYSPEFELCTSRYKDKYNKERSGPKQ